MLNTNRSTQRQWYPVLLKEIFTVWKTVVIQTYYYQSTVPKTNDNVEKQVQAVKIY